MPGDRVGRCPEPRWGDAHGPGGVPPGTRWRSLNRLVVHAGRARGCLPTPLLLGCVTLNRLLNLSGPICPHV